MVGDLFPLHVRHPVDGQPADPPVPLRDHANLPRSINDAVVNVKHRPALGATIANGSVDPVHQTVDRVDNNESDDELRKGASR